MRSVTLLTSALVAFSPKEVVTRKGNELAARESLSGISRTHLAKISLVSYTASEEVKKNADGNRIYPRWQGRSLTRFRLA